MVRRAGLREGRLWVHCLFQAWRMINVNNKLDGAEAEIQRLREKLGKQANSIWYMNKAELVETAVQEGVSSREKAQKMTVAEIRERIKSNRTAPEPEDPLLKLPTGLGRMTVDQLKAECDLRSLPYEEKTNKGKMLVLIKDDVEYRKSMISPEDQTQTEEEADQEETDWFEMEVEPTHHASRSRSSNER